MSPRRNRCPLSFTDMRMVGILVLGLLSSSAAHTLTGPNDVQGGGRETNSESQNECAICYGENRCEKSDCFPKGDCRDKHSPQICQKCIEQLLINEKDRIVKCPMCNSGMLLSAEQQAGWREVQAMWQDRLVTLYNDLAHWQCRHAMYRKYQKEYRGKLAHFRELFTKFGEWKQRWRALWSDPAWTQLELAEQLDGLEHSARTLKWSAERVSSERNGLELDAQQLKEDNRTQLLVEVGLALEPYAQFLEQVEEQVAQLHERLQELQEGLAQLPEDRARLQEDMSEVRRDEAQLPAQELSVAEQVRLRMDLDFQLQRRLLILIILLSLILQVVTFMSQQGLIAKH